MTTDADLLCHPDSMTLPTTNYTDGTSRFSSNPLPTSARIRLFTLGVIVGLVIGVGGGVVVHAAIDVFL